MPSLSSILSGWGLLVLRVVLGLILAAHGWPKLKDLKTTASHFTAMGFKPGVLWGSLVALLEFFGGLALIAGLFVQVVSGFMMMQFLVINVWKIAGRKPLIGGFELDLIIFAAAIVLFTSGAGAFSLDGFLFLAGV